jgi:NACalpha-BTF3-like transcription factor
MNETIKEAISANDQERIDDLQNDDDDDTEKTFMDLIEKALSMNVPPDWITALSEAKMKIEAEIKEIHSTSLTRREFDDLVDLIVKETSCKLLTARNALIFTNGDLVGAILRVTR